jgi:hypothetical protein
MNGFLGLARVGQFGLGGLSSRPVVTIRIGWWSGTGLQKGIIGAQNGCEMRIRCSAPRSLGSAGRTGGPWCPFTDHSIGISENRTLRHKHERTTGSQMDAMLPRHLLFREQGTGFTLLPRPWDAANLC